jgi:hypothetical protein
MQLARYLLQFRARGYRVGVLHVSDEDYTAATYFYPWVHYVIRNHWSVAHAGMHNVLAIPLGYKKGFHADAVQSMNGENERRYTWSFVGQIHDKPTRLEMLQVANNIPGGFYRYNL